MYQPTASDTHQPWLLCSGPRPLAVSWEPVTADTTYEAIDLEDCQPHLKAQDEEPHIYEEISKGGLDGGELSAQEGNPSVSAEIETSVMWLQRSLYL